MSRDIEMDDASTMMGEHDEDEKNLEPDRVYREEVDRSELGNMIGEEGSPRLGWRLGMADHVFGNGRLRNRYAQFQEFAVNSRRSPNRVVTTHGSNQITRLPRNTGTSRPAVTNLPSPVPLKSLTMPTDDGFRFDDDQGRAPTRPQTCKPTRKTSISSTQNEPVC